MNKKGLTIEQRLRKHPTVVMRRSPLAIWLGVAGVVAIAVAWVLIIMNGSEVQQELSVSDPVGWRQRAGSRFGVLIAAIGLPLFAISVAVSTWIFSKRYFVRETGSKLRRGYRQLFDGSLEDGDAFQQLLRTRDLSVIGYIKPGVARGNLIVEGWASQSDRFALVGVDAFNLKADRRWELVEFSGTDFPIYETLFAPSNSTRNSLYLRLPRSTRMSKKNPDIETRLRRHPSIAMRRSPVAIWIGTAAFLAIMACWVYVIVNGSELAQQFSQVEGGTVRYRVGRQFGVLIGILGLPFVAISVFVSYWYFSKRYFLRATGTRLRRSYRGIFPSSSHEGEAFQQQLRTRDRGVIGSMNAGVDRGNLIIEGWVAEPDQVAFVGVFAFDLKRDPHWELVEFSGDDFPTYQAIFGSGKA